MHVIGYINMTTRILFFSLGILFYLLLNKYVFVYEVYHQELNPLQLQEYSYHCYDPPVGENEEILSVINPKFHPAFKKYRSSVIRCESGYTGVVKYPLLKPQE